MVINVEIDELRVQATSKVINVKIDELRVQATSKVINVEINLRSSLYS
jgi:hypothetical protein